MSHRPTFTTALARLVPGADRAARGRHYRPLIAGPAVLERAPGAATWTVHLASDRLFRPRLPGPAAADGVVRRIGAALAGPPDVAPWGGSARMARAGRPPRLLLDIYGWALMYQPPGMRGRALVDADERFSDLPGVFELPLELIDRASFLEAHGFRTRPLVIPTARGDFERGPDGRLLNRFFPGARFRPPSSPDRIWWAA